MMRYSCAIHCASLCLLLAGEAIAADLNISQPKDRSVFQRNDRREAVIPVIGTISDARAVAMEVRAISHKTNSRPPTGRPSPR